MFNSAKKSIGRIEQKLIKRLPIGDGWKWGGRSKDDSETTLSVFLHHFHMIRSISNHLFLPKTYNLNLIMRNQRKPEFKTFYKTTGQDSSKKNNIWESKGGIGIILEQERYFR